MSRPIACVASRNDVRRRSDEFALHEEPLTKHVLAVGRGAGPLVAPSESKHCRRHRLKELVVISRGPIIKPKTGWPSRAHEAISP